MYQVGEFVWGKVPSYPWWPGEVYDPNSSLVTKDVRDARPGNDFVLVRFVNEHQDDFYWYARSDKNLQPCDEETFHKFESQKEVEKDPNLKWSINFVKSRLGKRKRDKIEGGDGSPSNSHPNKRIKENNTRRSGEEDEDSGSGSQKSSDDKKGQGKKTIKTISGAPVVSPPTVSKSQEKQPISDSELQKQYDRLVGGIESKNDTQILQVLKYIDEKCIIEVSQLRKIKIAKEINHLQKSANPQVKRLAAVITARFKSLVAKAANSGNASKPTTPVTSAKSESKPSPITPVKKQTGEQPSSQGSSSQPHIQDSISEPKQDNVNSEAKEEEALTQDEKEKIEADVKELVDMKKLEVLRAYFVNKIACALITNTSVVNSMVDLALKIENCAFNVYMKTENNKLRYRNQLQSIVFNLEDEKNPEFNVKIIGGKITPEDLSTMKSYDMASKDIKELRAEIIKEDIRMATVAKGESKGGGMFTCSKCKSDKVHTREVQTRSADEPMTVFASCLNCGRRWKM